MKAIIVSLALVVCWVSCAPTPSTTKQPFVKLSCKGHKSNGYFIDPKDPTIFHQCFHGQHIATFHCQGGTVFNETAEVCVSSHKIDIKCPQATGTFPHPTNPHKFIVCADGHAYVEACAADLVFDEKSKQCTYNENGLTWETDPPTTPTAASTAQPITGKPQTEPPHTNTNPEATATTGKATVGTLPATVSPKPVAECQGNGSMVDPADTHKYFVCKDGKKSHEICDQGLDFDPVLKECT